MSRPDIDRELAEEIIQEHPRFTVKVVSHYSDSDLEKLILSLSKPPLLKLLEELDPQLIAKFARPDQLDQLFLKDLSMNKLATVLRHSSLGSRKAIMATLSSYQRLYLSVLFSYTPDQVGFWMNPDVMSIDKDLKVKDARESLKKHRHGVDLVIVVDKNKFPVGTLSHAHLLHSADITPIKNVIKPLGSPLNASTNLVTIHESPGWAKKDFMCVVDSKNQLIGLLRHLDLRAGLKWLNRYTGQEKRETPLPAIVEAYGSVVFELFGLLGGASDSRD